MTAALLDERAFAGRVEPWVFGGVAANVEALMGVHARKEDAQVAVERAKVDARYAADGIAIEQPQRDVARVVHSGSACWECEEDLVGWCCGHDSGCGCCLFR